MKKLGLNSILNVVAAVLGAVGLIATVVTSMMGDAFVMNSLTTCILAGVCGVVLCGVAVAMRSNELVGAVSVWGAIAAYSVILYNIVMERMLLIGGLFSWNADNAEGWNVFYVTVVAVAGVLLASIVLMVSSFMKNKK